MEPALVATTGLAGLSTLGNRADLPPRVAALLGGLLAELRRQLEGPLANTLDAFEHDLFAQAERAPGNAAQQRHFEALREVKRGRSQVAPRFFAFLEGGLASLRAPTGTTGTEPTPAGESAPLRLVDTAVLDETLALRDIAGRTEIRHSEALYLLAHRMAVLGASAVPSAEALVVGPARLVAAFGHGIDALELAPEARLAAFRQFAQGACAGLDRVYAALNAWLAGQRILPHLDFQAHIRRPAATNPAGPHDGAQTAAAPAEDAGAADHPPPRPSPQAPSSAQGAPAPAPAASGAMSGAMFDMLRELLGERRRLEGDAPIAGNLPPSVSGGDLQAALDVLQRREQTGTPVHRDSEHLKNSLLVRLHRTSAPGQSVRLASEDADTIDLVGLLFDHIATNLRDGNQARALLSRLQVPVLRVALEDKSFFTRRDHPARELLNAIAETSSRWIDEEADGALLSRLQGVVDRVTADFDGSNVDVFGELLADLNHHMQTLARRAELAERRHIEAARGRDKLEAACEIARAAIRRVLETGAPDPVSRMLLERAWTDALALSALRHGPGSEEFQRRVAVADRLASDRSSSVQDLDARKELEKGLREVGLHEDDLGGVFAGLATPPAQVEAACSRLGETLESRQRLGGATTPAPPPGATVRVPLNDAELRQLAQLRRIPFGTWFDFTSNQQGERIRRKLAWYSPVSGRCLFLNQRGAHDGDRTLEQLAREMVLGQARIAPQESESLIDRAWTAIATALRRHVAPERITGTLQA